MKIQCTCGAKFAFDVTPDMAGRTVQFLCPSCGFDASAFVNQLIRQELSGASPAGGVPAGQAIQIPAPAAPTPSVPPGVPKISIAAPAPAPAPVAAAPQPILTAGPKISIPVPAPAPVTPTAPRPVVAASAPAPVPAPAPRAVPAPIPIPAPAALVPSVPVAAAPALSIAGRGHAAVAAPAAAEVAGGEDAPRCSKHPNVQATDRCYVCSKPICPKCMELFGYLCSPLCKAKAEANGIKVPKFAGQKSLVEAQLWRKVGRVTFAVLGVVGLWLGLWFWYAWFGSRPSPAFSVHFDEPSFSGQSAMCGPDQLVYVHGGQLARYDIKQKKKVWSRELVDPKQVEENAAKAIKALQDAVANSPMSAHDNPIRIPPIEIMIKRVQRAEEADLHLRVLGDNIWVITSQKLVHFNKDAGIPDKEIPVPKDASGQLIPRGDELVQTEMDLAGNESINHINLNTCETRVESVRKVSAFSTNDSNRLLATALKSGAGKKGGKGGTDLAGLPTKAGGKDAGKPMDPKKVSEQASHMSLPERMALPVTLANARNQQRALDEAKDPDDPVIGRARQGGSDEDFRLMLTKDGFMQLAVKMIEEHHTERVAMKPAPTKSVLDGNLTAGKTAELANEMLNQSQRELGGETEREDQSVYKVTFKKADDPSPWTGQVIGQPQLFPLNTVDVLSSNKKITVFDKSHKQLWEAALTFNVGGGGSDLEDEDNRHGEGPCVEHKDGLYVFDKGVLTAFDLASGNVRWRLPSVGITGIFFDEHDDIYVNTTSASPETLKYTRQIDITQKNAPIIIKVEGKTGKGLWAVQSGGRVTYVSGKFVYTLEQYSPFEDDEHPFEATTGFETPPYVRIKRLNPKTGRQMWEYARQKAPFDVQFDKNTIRIVLKNEVTVLKYFTL